MRACQAAARHSSIMCNHDLMNAAADAPSAMRTSRSTGAFQRPSEPAPIEGVRRLPASEVQAAIGRFLYRFPFHGLPS